jgi:two-component system, NarL family, sensor histidine kinase UhpB
MSESWQLSASPTGSVAATKVSLLTRVLAMNAAVLLIAGLALVLTPATVSDPVSLEEVVELVAGLVLLVVANLFLLRRAFAPLQRLTSSMGRIDHLSPGPRVPVYGGDAEIVRLTEAFNEMLDRLESERRSSFQRSAEAQENERRLVAQELHDEVGQSLTALKLLLAQVARTDAPKRKNSLDEATRLTEQTIEDVREIARRLRPEALDELGLRSALATLAQRNARHGDIRIVWRLDRGLPELEGDRELAIYRVAQESLTNILRHAQASNVSVRLIAKDSSVELIVSDDGCGLGGAAAGNGIKGMKERALGVGGRVDVRDRAGGGTDVSLVVPLQPAEEHDDPA